MSAIIAAAQFKGGFLSIADHKFDVVGDYTLADWMEILSVLSAATPDINVVNIDDFSVSVTSPGDWTCNTGVCSRAALTDNSDYNLRSSSSLKNAGIDVDLTTDFIGNPIKGFPDIGAYEYRGGWFIIPGTHIWFGVGGGGSAATYVPTESGLLAYTDEDLFTDSDLFED